MPKKIDVTKLTQDAVSQIMGTDYMTSTGDFAALDSYKLADVGNSVFNASDGKDMFVKCLVDAMGKFEAESRPYTGDLSSIMVEPMEWGGFIERAYFSPSDLISDPMYNLVDGSTYDDHKFYQPKVSAKFYQEMKAILSPISIVDEQLHTAFTGWDEMEKFISAIRTNVANTMEIGINSYKHMLAQCAIAVSDAGNNNAVHLLSDAVAQGIVSAATTADEAMTNPDFLAYALMRIADTRDNMRIMSTAYNNGAVPTHSYSDDDTKTVLLSKFEKACRFLLRARAFNSNELSIGEYDRTAAWQGHDNGTTKFDFTTVSSVSISADSDNKLGIGTSAYSKSNVIALMFDRKALGLCPYKRKVTSSYTAISDHWNEYHHLMMNALLDANYNIVAFIVD